MSVSAMVWSMYIRCVLFQGLPRHFFALNTNWLVFLRLELSYP